MKIQQRETISNLLLLLIMVINIAAATDEELISQEVTDFVTRANRAFKTSMNQSEARISEKRILIEDNYHAAMATRKERAIAEGRLAAVLAWDAEMKRLAQGEIPLEPDEFDKDPELASFRKTYRSALEAIRMEQQADQNRLKKIRDFSLESLQRKLTREKRLAEAKYILDERNKNGKIFPVKSEPLTIRNDRSSRKWNGELVVEGKIEGKTLRLPIEMNTKRIDWIRTDAMKSGFLAGSYEDGVYYITTEGVKKVHSRPARDFILEGTCAGTVLTMDNELQWQVVRNKTTGTIKDVDKYFSICVGGPDGFWSILALKMDGSLELEANNVPLEWDFETWQASHKFRDLAMADWRGFRIAAFAITDRDELFAFNNKGIFKLPAWLSSDVESVCFGRSGISFGVVKKDGSVYDFMPGKLPEEYPLDNFFEKWKKAPDGVFGALTPIYQYKSVSSKAIQFKDGSWIAINSRSGFAPEFHRSVTSQGPFKDVKIRTIDRFKTDFIVGIR